MKKLLFALLLIVGFSTLGHAECAGSPGPNWTCTTFADFEALVEGGDIEGGDVVTASSFTLTSQVVIDNGITVQGTSACTLVNGKPTSCPTIWTFNYSAGINIVITLEAAKTTRFTNIEFRDDTELSNNTAISVEGCNTGSPQRQIRLDHLFFNDLDRRIGEFYSPVGVVDHNNIEHQLTGFNNIIFRVNGVFYNSCGVNDYADGSMSADLQAGSDQSLYFEDNQFTNLGTSQVVAFDCDLGGARYSVRFNDLENMNIQCHGFEVSRYRGQRLLEWYLNNLYDGNDTLQTPFFIRGGSGYFWGNAIEGWTTGANLGMVNYLQQQNSPFPWGNNGGRGPWTKNSTSAVATGTCDSVTATTCTVTGTPFTPNQYESQTTAYMLNRTTGGVAMASATRSSDTLTFTSSGSHGFATNDYIGCWGADTASYGYNSVFSLITVTGATTFTADAEGFPFPSMTTAGTYRCAKGSNFAILQKNTNNTLTWTASANTPQYDLQLATGDGWEINIITNTMDQTCRGGGSYLGGAGVLYPTVPMGWNDQVTDGCYDWTNAREGGTLVNLSSGYSFACTNSPNNLCTYNTLVPNVTYWNYNATATTSGTNQTAGVRSGTFANRPGTCTTGVAYWATDQGSWNAGSNAFYTGQGNLYKCTATDTWTLVYTPYAYPHPLVSGLTLTDIDPNFGERGSTIMAIEISGTELEGGDMGASTVVNVSGSGVTPDCTVDSDVLITCDFEIDMAATLGDRSVTVVTDVATSNPVTFTVTGTNAPVLTSVLPAQGTAGASYSMAFIGTGFDGGNATINDNCGALTFSGTVVVSPTKIMTTATIAVGGGAVCDISIETDDGESNPETFTIDELPLRGYGVGRTRRKP